MVSMLLPHLAGLARLARVSPSARAQTAGIFASGRLVVNPGWFLALSPQDRIFVTAHELLHLAMRSHERCAGAEAKLFNIAHDYVINDILRDSLHAEVPAGGLDWPGAAALSAEAIVADLRRRRSSGEPLPGDAWSGPYVGAIGAALARAGLLDATRLGAVAGRDGATAIDVLADERDWFPDEDARSLAAAAAAIAQAGDKALALGAWRARTEAAFTPPAGQPTGADSAMVRVLDARLHPPWQLALQRWVDETTLGLRSYGRASRRQGERSDVVLAGRRREGQTINLVLDTSGSMWSVLARTLGVLKGFCEAAGVCSVRILQCGESLEADERVEVSALDSYRILGGRGGDLKPGMRRLALDPEVEAALVITDACEDIPEEPMPYSVLWAITGEVPAFFRPSYGVILRIWD
jgi:predicted metal-dependent peptidase